MQKSKPGPKSLGKYTVLEGPDPGAVRAALERLLASPQFAHSRQLQRFLEFTVERTLSGRSTDIKEYTIAVEVFGRDESHDPSIDPIVRTEARRLRRKLREYQKDDGAEEFLRIDYPKGSYVPRFLGRTPSRPIPRRFSWRIPAVVVTGLCLLLIGAFLWTHRGRLPQPTSNGGAIEKPRIVVLPFDDFSPGAADPSLTFAITESLMTRLVKLDGLSVASRISVARAKDRNLGPREIASLFQADYIVEGSVIRSGSACRVSAVLFRARDERELWAEEYDLRWSDLLDVTSRVAESVAGALSVVVGEDAAGEAALSENLEVVESYSRGQYYLLQFQIRRLRPHASEAERYLKKTLELAPEHIDAMVALAELSHERLYPPQGNRDELLARTERYLEQALATSPNHAGALALLSLAAAERGDRDEALRVTRRALELAPQDARIHSQMGARLGERGFYESALAQYEEALVIDPLLPVAHAARVWLLGKLGRFDEAFEAHELLRRLEPEGPTIDAVLGDVYFMAGNLAEARQVWDRGRASAVQDADTSYLEIAIGLLDALGGNEEEARRVADKYRESPPRALDHLIQLFAEVGETELALYHIRHSPYYANYRWLVATPAMRALHEAPGFRDLFQEYYLQWQRDVTAAGAELSYPPVLSPPEDLMRRTASDRSVFRSPSLRILDPRSASGDP